MLTRERGGEALHVEHCSSLLTMLGQPCNARSSSTCTRIAGHRVSCFRLLHNAAGIAGLAGIWQSYEGTQL